MNDEEQQFLNDLDRRLWDAAEQFTESVRQEAEIRKNLAGLGHAL